MGIGGNENGISHVSVPLRGYGFEIGEFCVCHGKYEKFPSPCGDMVLKSSDVKLHEFLYKVSVPLRGYGFEIRRIPLQTTLSQPVSVPLRGYGFEIKTKTIKTVVSTLSFRPLAGIWF